jgi:hypothetical protein
MAVFTATETTMTALSAAEILGFASCITINLDY